MKIQVLYFAVLRDQAQKSQDLIDARNSCTVGELFQLVEERSALRLEGVRAAVNQEFVPPSHILEEGDVIALIPPVSGG